MVLPGLTAGLSTFERLCGCPLAFFGTYCLWISTLSVLKCPVGLTMILKVILFFFLSIQAAENLGKSFQIFNISPTSTWRFRPGNLLFIILFFSFYSPISPFRSIMCCTWPALMNNEFPANGLKKPEKPDKSKKIICPTYLVNTHKKKKETEKKVVFFSFPHNSKFALSSTALRLCVDNWGSPDHASYPAHLWCWLKLLKCLFGLVKHRFELV